MLLFAPHPAEKFSAPISGLRSLLVVHDAAAGGTRGGGCVVTRAAVAAHGCGCVGGHRDDVVKDRHDDVETSLGRGGEDVVETAKEEEENGDMEGKERGEARTEDEDEMDGFWVSYGRRCPRRRLPPPIPSLVARGALRRTRTDDGRLVIRIVPVVRPERIRARRRRDRLVVLEHEDHPPTVAPPPPPFQEPMSAAPEDGIIRINVAHQADDGAATPDAGKGVRDVEDAVAAPVAVPPPRVPSVGCFEEVFKLGSIGSSCSLHQMPSLRMVH